MLIGFAGKMTGYNGSFAFKKPGDQYKDVAYVGMRMVDIRCCKLTLIGVFNQLKVGCTVLSGTLSLLLFVFML